MYVLGISSKTHSVIEIQSQDIYLPSVCLWELPCGVAD